MDEAPVQPTSEAIVPAPPQQVEETSHNTQLSTEFVPSDNQLKWFNTAVAVASKSPTEIADELGMARETFYKWMKDPKFRAWWEEQWATYYQNMKHKLFEIGVKQAETNHSWWRDMMEILGFAKPKEDKPAAQNTINVMANAFAQKQKESGQ